MTDLERLATGVVIVGLNSSIEGAEALWHARSIAEVRASDLVVMFTPKIRVVDAFSVAGGAAGAMAFAIDDEERAALHQTTAILDNFVGEWRWVSREGDPARQLAKLADECDADLLVLSSRDRRGGRRSAAARLLQYSTRAVLICGRR